MSTAILTGCDKKPSVNADNFYTNNFYIPGAGYYHAPFRNWYPLPYNHFDAQKQLYFYGGQWGSLPCESITNISTPTPDAVTLAEAARTDIVRGGFGGFGGGGGYYGGGWHSWGGGFSGFHGG